MPVWDSVVWLFVVRRGERYVLMCSELSAWCLVERRVFLVLGSWFLAKDARVDTESGVLLLAPGRECTLLRRATELPEGVLSCQQRFEGLNQKAQGSKAFLTVLRTVIV
jgi:hypothetical protein